MAHEGESLGRGRRCRKKQGLTPHEARDAARALKEVNRRCRRWLVSPQLLLADSASPPRLGASYKKRPSCSRAAGRGRSLSRTAQREGREAFDCEARKALPYVEVLQAVADCAQKGIYIGGAVPSKTRHTLRSP